MKTATLIFSPSFARINHNNWFSFYHPAFGYCAIWLALYCAEGVLVKLPAVVRLLVEAFRDSVILLTIKGKAHRICSPFI